MSYAGNMAAVEAAGWEFGKSSVGLSSLTDAVLLAKWEEVSHKFYGWLPPTPPWASESPAFAEFKAAARRAVRATPA